MVEANTPLAFFKSIVWRRRLTIIGNILGAIIKERRFNGASYDSKTNCLYVYHKRNRVFIPSSRGAYAKKGEDIHNTLLARIIRPHDDKPNYIDRLVERVRTELTQGRSQSETDFEKKVNKYHPNLSHEIIANQRVREKMIERFKALYGVEKGE